MDSYILGILWACASPGGPNYLWVRHQERYYPATVREYFGCRAKVHESYSRTGRQYRLKLLKQYCEGELLSQGWAPRQEHLRPYPAGDIDDQHFMRAWVELHGILDTTRVFDKRRDRERVRLRLRIYGGPAFLQEASGVFAVHTGASPKKVQPVHTQTGETACLYYQSKKEVHTIFAWLYAGAKLFSPERKLEFNEVLEEVGYVPTESR